MGCFRPNDSPTVTSCSSSSPSSSSSSLASNVTPFLADFVLPCSFLCFSRTRVKCCTANSTKSVGRQRRTSTVYPCRSSCRPAGVSDEPITSEGCGVWTNDLRVRPVTAADQLCLNSVCQTHSADDWFLYSQQPSGNYWSERCSQRPLITQHNLFIGHYFLSSNWSYFVIFFPNQF